VSPSLRVYMSEKVYKGLKEKKEPSTKRVLFI
jgi:hypothetical protein